MGALHPPASFFVIRTLIIAYRDSHCTKTNKREPIQHTFNNLLENLLKVEKKCSLSLRKFRVFFDSGIQQLSPDFFGQVSLVFSELYWSEHAMEVCTRFESALVPSSSATATMLSMTHGEYLLETNGLKIQ